MTRQCAWCKQRMGEAAPLEDGSVTHGICRRCREALLDAAGLHDSHPAPDAPVPLEPCTPVD